jgi:EF-P beta-lysylation protein EpmB
MNLETAALSDEPDWKAALRDAVRDPAELCRLLELSPATLGGRIDAGSPFPLLVPRGFVRRMRKQDPFDPLLLQVLPTRAETIPGEGFGPDPLAEQGLAVNGSIQKYPGRVLLIATGACPVHCRYCFRREFPYATQTAAAGDFEPALEAIRRRPDIGEIILSGGDPLSLGNERLGRLVAAIEGIAHVSTLRIHTRYPVVLPARVDAGLVSVLGRTRLNVVVVLHTNHPAEIDASVAAAAAKLKPCAAYLLNQSVLLRGINDSVDTLIALSQRLLDIAVTPYYLHLLDRVSGTAAFEVSAAEGLELIAAMRRQVPGYLVPRLVRDVARELSKTPIESAAV